MVATTSWLIFRSDGDSSQPEPVQSDQTELPTSSGEVEDDPLNPSTQGEDAISNPSGDQPRVPLVRREAVTAAALAVDRLSQAMLLPEDEMREVVNTTAVESSRGDLIAVLPSAGEEFAAIWGWSDVATARRNSFHYVNTLKYRVGGFSENRASIWLYTVNHWVSRSFSDLCDSSRNCEYSFPNIDIVDLEKIDGHWKYKGRRNPPADKVPSFSQTNPELNLSFVEAQQLFQPFLAGFSDYESVQQEDEHDHEHE